MLLPRIKTFLQNPANYAAGLQLLKETGFSGFSLRLLERGEDAYTQSRLVDELTAWANSQPEPKTEPAPVRVIGPAPGLASALTPTQTKPAGVVELEQQAGTLMDERTELKARIRARMDQDDAQPQRKDDALRILAIGRELDELYSRVDFYHEHGYLPPDKNAGGEIDDLTLLRNVRTYVSLYKGKLKKKGLAPERVAAYTQLLQQYEVEKARLEIKLSNLQLPNHHDSHPSG